MNTWRERWSKGGGVRPRPVSCHSGQRWGGGQATPSQLSLKAKVGVGVQATPSQLSLRVKVGVGVQATPSQLSLRVKVGVQATPSQLSLRVKVGVGGGVRPRPVNCHSGQSTYYKYSTYNLSFQVHPASRDEWYIPHGKPMKSTHGSVPFKSSVASLYIGLALLCFAIYSMGCVNIEE